MDEIKTAAAHIRQHLHPAAKRWQSELRILELSGLHGEPGDRQHRHEAAAAIVDLQNMLAELLAESQKKMPAVVARYQDVLGLPADSWGPRPPSDSKWDELHPALLALELAADVAELREPSKPPADAKPANGKPDKKQRQKKSTTPGDARDAIETAFLTWHEYKPGCVGKYDAIGVTELADKTNGAAEKASVSGFFKDQFGKHRTYKGICQKQAPKLELVLRELWNHRDGQKLRGLGRNRDAAERQAEYDRAGDDSESDE